MIDKLHYACLVGVFGACLAAGCSSAPAEKPQQSTQGGAAASSVPPVQSPVSINAEMVRVVDHAAHQSWNAEKEGIAPKTDADWENIVEHATQIAAAGALIRLEGTGPNDRTFVQQPEWQKFAAAVSNAGMAALRAADAKNQGALVTVNGQLVEACEGCHKQFKPALPSEGIMHSHVH
jgi:hypothetical protein